jgi:hypothetical protein
MYIFNINYGAGYHLTTTTTTTTTTAFCPKQVGVGYHLTDFEIKKNQLGETKKIWNK